MTFRIIWIVLFYYGFSSPVMIGLALGDVPIADGRIVGLPFNFLWRTVDGVVLTINPAGKVQILLMTTTTDSLPHPPIFTVQFLYIMSHSPHIISNSSKFCPIPPNSFSHSLSRPLHSCSIPLYSPPIHPHIHCPIFPTFLFYSPIFLIPFTLTFSHTSPNILISSLTFLIAFTITVQLPVPTFLF